MAYRSRERAAKILSHREADRVPYCAINSERISRIVESMRPAPDHREFCLEGDFGFVTLEPDADRGAFEPYVGGVPEGAEVSCWGVASVRLTTDAGWHAGWKHLHPLAKVDTVEELERYPFPDIAGCGIDRGLEEKVRALKRENYTVLGQMSQTILETAYLMRGMPALMADFYERPEYVERLFEKLAERRRFQARRFAEAGVDILRIGDDIASQQSLLVSPKLYRERIKPFHSSVIAAARTVNPEILVKYHSDGNLTALLPDLIEIGVNIINPAQPECMDLAAVKRHFGSRLTLWGCMPCQSIMEHGSRDDVIGHLRFLMEKVAPGGGLVLKFTNFLETDKSLDNLRTFLDAFYEIGRYGSES